MAIQSDQKALLFLVAVAVLGAGMRVARASGRSAATVTTAALDRQAQAADSAARASRVRGGTRGAARSRGRRAGGTGSASTTPAGTLPPRDTIRPHGPLDRPGWIGPLLDLDVATAAQLDSLPGVTPAMAKRIVADRMMRGPFLNRAGLRRVSGVGPRFIEKIETLVTFSGTFAWADPHDTIIPRAKPARRTQSKRSTAAKPP